MEKLKYFIGKVCTILTKQTNRLYNDEQHANSFTGIVEEIDQFGVWIRMLPKMDRKAFFAAPIIGIIEEEIIPITEEEEQEIKEKYLQRMENPVPDNLISLGGIKELAQRTKSKFNS